MGLKTTLRATDMASARFLSISLRMSFDGPRRRMVHALGVLHSVRNVKYLRNDKQEGRWENKGIVKLTRPQFFQY